MKTRLILSLTALSGCAPAAPAEIVVSVVDRRCATGDRMPNGLARVDAPAASRPAPERGPAPVPNGCPAPPSRPAAHVLLVPARAPSARP